MLPHPLAAPGTGLLLGGPGAEIGQATQRLGQPIRRGWPGMSAAAILLSLTQTGLKKRRSSGTLFPRHAVGPRCGGSDRRAAPRPIRAWKLGGPAGPGSRGAGAAPTRGWPFRRGLPHACTLRDAPARGSLGGRGRGRKRGAGGRCPPRETKARARARPTGCGARPDPSCPAGKSRLWRVGAARGSRSRPGG